MKNGVLNRAISTVVAGFLAITSVSFTAKSLNTDAAKVLTTSPQHDSERGWYNNYHHEIWQADTPNSSTMTLSDNGGGFSTQWKCGPNNSRGNFLARRGLFYDLNNPNHWQDYGGFTCDFDCTWSAGSSGNSRICIYGWTQNPLVEYYIIEDWKNWQPGQDPTSKYQGTAFIDGSNYKIYTSDRNSYTIEGNKPFTQYISVRENTRTKGTISISEHFKKWESLGMKMGNFYEVAFNVEGWESDGQATVDCTIKEGSQPPTDPTEPTEPPTAPEPDKDGNYLTENFESGKGSFTGRGDATVSVDTKNYYDGGSSLKISGRTQNWHGGAISLDSSTFVPGNTYSISAAAMQKSGSTKDLKLTLEYTAGDQDWKEVASVDAESGVWTKLENTKFTIPSGASKMTLYLESSDENLDFYLDSVQIAKEGKESSVKTGGGTVEGQTSTTTTTSATQKATTTTTTTTTQPSSSSKVTKYGDANCDTVVNIADAVLAMQVATNPDKYAAGKTSSSITEVGEANADVDGTGSITNNDALLIQKFKLGLISEFPAESQKKNLTSTTTTTTTTKIATTTEGPIVTAAPANYFKSSFNSGVDSWQGRGDASVAVNKDNYIDGSSLKVTGRSKEWNGAQIKLDDSFKAGGTYSISAGVLQKVKDSDNFKISLEFTKNGGDKDYDTIAEGKVSKNTWTKLENTAYTVPEGATDLVLYVETAETTIDFFVDEFSIQAQGTKSSITTGKGTVSDDPEPEIGKVDPSKPMIAISFDDGCSPANNKKIVDALTEQGFHATFFYVSNWSQGAENQAEIKYAYSKGMEIANHTVSHPYLGQKSSAEIRQEADGCHNYLKSVIGAEPSKLLRLPYLDQGGAVKSTLTDYGLVTDAIDTQDYMDNVTKDQIVQTIKNSMANGSGNGAVVLCHETKDKTAQAIVELAPYIKAQGWQIVTISEMFAAKGKAIPYGQIITRV